MTSIITPQKSTVSVSVPQEYIGKPVAVTMVLVGNKEKEDVQPKPATRLADKYRGVFSAKDAESFMNHTKQMREEWNTI